MKRLDGLQWTVSERLTFSSYRFLSVCDFDFSSFCEGHFFSFFLSETECFWLIGSLNLQLAWKLLCCLWDLLSLVKGFDLKVIVQSSVGPCTVNMKARRNAWNYQQYGHVLDKQCTCPLVNTVANPMVCAWSLKLFTTFVMELRQSISLWMLWDSGNSLVAALPSGNPNQKSIFCKRHHLNKDHLWQRPLQKTTVVRDHDINYLWKNS